MKIILILVCFIFPSSSFGFNNHYDCIQIGSSSLGWDSIKGEYDADSSTKSDKPIIVKITDLNTTKPYLSGQSTTSLTKVSKLQDVLWLVEVTPGGTVVTWTLFEKNIENKQPKTLLISSKSYDLVGPFNFTTIYECIP